MADIDWKIMDKVALDKKEHPDDYRDQYQHEYWLSVTKPKREKERKEKNND